MFVIRTFITYYESNLKAFYFDEIIRGIQWLPEVQIQNKIRDGRTTSRAEFSKISIDSTNLGGKYS